MPESVLENTDQDGELFPVEVCIILKEKDRYVSKNDSCIYTKWEFLKKYLPEIAPINFSIWK